MSISASAKASIICSSRFILQEVRRSRRCVLGRSRTLQWFFGLGRREEVEVKASVLKFSPEVLLVSGSRAALVFGKRRSLEGCGGCRYLLWVFFLSPDFVSSTFLCFSPSSSPTWAAGWVELGARGLRSLSAGVSGCAGQMLVEGGAWVRGGVGTWPVSGSWSSWLEEWSICGWRTNTSQDSLKYLKHTNVEFHWIRSSTLFCFTARAGAQRCLQPSVGEITPKSLSGFH